MYLPKNYRAQIYHDLFRMTDKIMNIAFGIESTSHEIERTIMLELGIEKVRRGNKKWVCLDGESCRPREVETAFRYFVEEVPKYLSRHFEKYRRDLMNGVFQDVQQAEFQFEEGFTTRKLNFERPTREENAARFFSEIVTNEKPIDKKKSNQNSRKKIQLRLNLTKTFYTILIQDTNGKEIQSLSDYKKRGCH